MKRPRVFVTRQLPGDALDRLAAACSIDVFAGDAPPSYDELVGRSQACEALLCLLTDRVDEALMTACPRLRVISTMAVGTDHIDVGAATRRAIPVGHTPGVLTETTADLAFALMLATARRLPEADAFVRAGRWRTWSPDLLLGHDVQGATLGIIGYGAIGKALARRATGFGMEILFHTRSAVPAGPSGRPVPLDHLLRVSDFVSLHVPLTSDTANLIGSRELEVMRPTAILINTARGGIVDQPALVEALRAGAIAGAGLDVAAVEPIPPGDALLAAPNTVLLPHIGSASVKTRAQMASMAVENCLAALRGERMPHCANSEIYR